MTVIYIVKQIHVAVTAIGEHVDHCTYHKTELWTNCSCCSTEQRKTCGQMDIMTKFIHYLICWTTRHNCDECVIKKKLLMCPYHQYVIAQTFMKITSRKEPEVNVQNDNGKIYGPVTLM